MRSSYSSYTVPNLFGSPMAKDHFVSQVYLKQWADPKLNGKVHVHRKGGKPSFAAHPYDLFRIEDGNTNNFLDDPRELEKLAEFSEPAFEPALANLRDGIFNERTRLVIANLMTYFILASPTQMELMRPGFSKLILKFAKEVDKQGNISPFPNIPDHRFSGKSLSDLIEAGEIKADVDMRAPQALSVNRAENLIRVFYNSDWRIVKSAPNNPFLTSDFPVTFIIKERDTNRPRFFPLAPDIGIVVYSRRLDDDGTGFSYNPVEQLGKHWTANLNREVVRGANDLVVSNAKYPWLKDFVRRYSKYRLVVNDYGVDFEETTH